MSSRLLRVPTKTSDSNKSRRKSSSDKGQQFDPGSPKVEGEISCGSRSSTKSILNFKDFKMRSVSSSAERRKSTSIETAKVDDEKIMLQNKRMSLLNSEDDEEKLDGTAPLLAIRKVKGRGTSIHSLASIEEKTEKPAIVGLRRKSSNYSLEEASSGKLSTGINPNLKSAQDRKRSLPLVINIQSQPHFSNMNISAPLSPKSLNKISLEVSESSFSSLASVRSKESFEARKSRLSDILQQRRRMSSVKDNGENIPVAFRAFYRKRSEIKGLQTWNELYNTIRIARLMSFSAKKFVKAKLEKLNLEEKAAVFENSFEAPWIDQLRKLLEIPTARRGPERITRIREIIEKRFPEFASYLISDQDHMCKIMQFETFEANRCIFWENSTCTKFYMLAKGKVEKLILNDGRLISTFMVESGSMFGHQCMTIKDFKRTNIAICATDVSLLTIDLEEYGKKPDHEKKIEDPLLSLNNESIFASNPLVFQKLILFFNLKEYSKGNIIVSQGELIDRISWIVKGTCRISVKMLDDTQERSSKRMDAQDETEIQTQPNIQFGNYFPNFVDFQPQTSSYQVTAYDDKVLIASISLPDFKTFANDEIIKKLQSLAAVAPVSMDEIRKELATQQGWKNHKNEVIMSLQKK